MVPRKSTSHFIAAIASVAVMGVIVGGCASVDPTDPSHFVDVQVRNDTALTVELIQCDTSCSTLHDRQTLPPGANTRINVSNEGIEVGYAVESLSGKRLGCIYVDNDHVKHPATLTISSMTDCH